MAPEGFGLAYNTAAVYGLSVTAAITLFYVYQIKRHNAFAVPVFMK